MDTSLNMWRLSDIRRPYTRQKNIWFLPSKETRHTQSSFCDETQRLLLSEQHHIFDELFPEGNVCSNDDDS